MAHIIISCQSFLCILKQGCCTAAGVLLVMLAVDLYLYGEATITPINFLISNLVNGFARLYGVNPWYWNVVVVG